MEYNGVLRVEGIANTFNALRSTVDIELYSSDLHHVVILHEVNDNPGPSVTNAAETICPAIARKLQLSWKRCVFIESYPPAVDLYQPDPTYDRIIFETPPAGGLSPSGEPLLVATLAGWRPLSIELARELQRAGCPMTQHIGARVGLLTDGPADGSTVTVTGYDGRQYHTEQGTFLARQLKFM